MGGIGGLKGGGQTAEGAFYREAVFFQQGAVGVGGKGLLMAHFRMVVDGCAQGYQLGLQILGELGDLIKMVHEGTSFPSIKRVDIRLEGAVAKHVGRHNEHAAQGNPDAHQGAGEFEPFFIGDLGHSKDGHHSAGHRQDGVGETVAKLEAEDCHLAVDVEHVGQRDMMGMVAASLAGTGGDEEVGQDLHCIHTQHRDGRGQRGDDAAHGVDGGVDDHALFHYDEDGAGDTHHDGAVGDIPGYRSGNA